MMSRLWRRWLPIKIVLAGGWLAVACFPLIAEEGAAPTNSPKPAEPAAAAPAGEAAASAPKHRLAFKFEPDQMVRYSVKYEMELTTHFSGSTETARNKSDSRRSYKVTQVSPEGEGDLQLSIEWVRMTAQFDNGITKTKPIEFQSDDKSKHPPQFQHILATVGPPQATIRFSPFGRPLKVEPLNGGPPASPPAATSTVSPAANPGPAPNAMMAADASHENYLILLPEQPVAVGESWKERFEIIAREPPENLPIRVTLQRTYKLADVKEGRATIEFRTAILTPIQVPAIAAQLIQRETSGKFVFDIEKGLILSRDVACDRTVVAPFGDKGSMRAVSKYHEELIPSPATASRDTPAPTTSAKQ